MVSPRPALQPLSPRPGPLAPLQHLAGLVLLPVVVVPQLQVLLVQGALLVLQLVQAPLVLQLVQAQAPLVLPVVASQLLVLLVVLLVLQPLVLLKAPRTPPLQARHPRRPQPPGGPKLRGRLAWPSALPSGPREQHGEQGSWCKPLLTKVNEGERRRAWKLQGTAAGARTSTFVQQDQHASSILTRICPMALPGQTCNLDPHTHMPHALQLQQPPTNVPTFVPCLSCVNICGMSNHPCSPQAAGE